MFDFDRFYAKKIESCENNEVISYFKTTHQQQKHDK